MLTVTQTASLVHMQQGLLQIPCASANTPPCWLPAIFSKNHPSFLPSFLSPCMFATSYLSKKASGAPISTSHIDWVNTHGIPCIFFFLHALDVQYSCGIKLKTSGEHWGCPGSRQLIFVNLEQKKWLCLKLLWIMWFADHYRTCGFTFHFSSFRGSQKHTAKFCCWGLVVNLTQS